MYIFMKVSSCLRLLKIKDVRHHRTGSYGKYVQAVSFHKLFNIFTPNHAQIDLHQACNFVANLKSKIATIELSFR